MKTICIFKNGLRHFADSSAQRNRQPYFIPDEDSEWSAGICPAIKITRLGTHIAEKFAGRYYDKIATACIFMPEGLQSGISADDHYYIRDSAFCIGDESELSSQDKVHKIKAGDLELNFSADSLNINRYISNISKFTTLKMGDVLIFADQMLKHRLIPDQRLEVTLDKTLSIDLKII